MTQSNQARAEEGLVPPAQPARLAFCTRWSLENDDEVVIEDEFDELRLARIPYEVSDAFPVFLAVFWAGNPNIGKPQLRVMLPNGDVNTLRLPALKPFFNFQIQLTSLAGLTFNDAGRYVFEVQTSFDTASKELRVIKATTASS